MVIGGLMAKADTPTKSVITAYDPSKDRTTNRTVLGGSKFQASTLDACVNFFKIATIDENGNRIYSNKPSLAMRIILEIETFFPTICGQCDEEYCNKFDSPTSPALQCFLCFQGSHSCEQTAEATANLHAIPTALPHGSGTVWLCKLCLMQNNPVPSKRSKSNRNHCPSTASVAASTHTSLTVIPVENKQSGITADELCKKLAVVHHQQQQTASLTSPPTSLSPGATPDPGPPSTKKPSDDHICAEYKLGKCPHGVSGRTLHQGETCKKSHPKRCRKFTRFGNDPSKGCTLGSGCHFYYHPQQCKNSVQNKQCFNEKCTLVHMVGTIRVKPSKENRKKSGKYPSQRKSRPDRGSYRRAESESTVASD